MPPELRRRWPISYLGISARGRAVRRRRSDLDLLVEFDGLLPDRGEVDLERKLNDRLGVKVDIVPRQRLRRFIGQHILHEVQPV
jgi:predicted nucleotidyltransferase